MESATIITAPITSWRFTAIVRLIVLKKDKDFITDEWLYFQYVYKIARETN